MDHFSWHAVWQLWKMHAVFPLEADAHSALISRRSHRLCEDGCWSCWTWPFLWNVKCWRLWRWIIDQMCFIHVIFFFFSTFKFQNLHELFMSAQSHLHRFSPTFMKDYGTKWSGWNWPNFMEIIDFEGIFMQSWSFKAPLLCLFENSLSCSV